MKWNILIATLCTVFVVLAGWSIERGFGASEKAGTVETRLAIHEAAQIEREKAILEKLEEIRADVKEIRSTLRNHYARPTR